MLKIDTGSRRAYQIGISIYQVALNALTTPTRANGLFKGEIRRDRKK